MFDIAARKSLNLKERTSALLPRHPVDPSQRQLCSRFSGRFGPRLGGLRSLQGHAQRPQHLARFVAVTALLAVDTDPRLPRPPQACITSLKRLDSDEIEDLSSSWMSEQVPEDAARLPRRVCVRSLRASTQPVPSASRSRLVPARRSHPTTKSRTL